MPRSALLRPKTKIWAVTGNLGLESECSERKNRAAAKTNFATALFDHLILRKNYFAFLFQRSVILQFSERVKKNWLYTPSTCHMFFIYLLALEPFILDR